MVSQFSKKKHRNRRLSPTDAALRRKRKMQQLFANRVERQRARSPTHNHRHARGDLNNEELGLDSGSLREKERERASKSASVRHRSRARTEAQYRRRRYLRGDEMNPLLRKEPPTFAFATNDVKVDGWPSMYVECR